MRGRRRDPDLLPHVVPGVGCHETKHLHSDDYRYCLQRVYTGMCLHLRGQATSKLHWPWARPVCPHMFLVFLTEHTFPRGFIRKKWKCPSGSVVRTPCFHCQHFHCSIPHLETQILQAAWHGQKKKNLVYPYVNLTRPGIL